MVYVSNSYGKFAYLFTCEILCGIRAFHMYEIAHPLCEIMLHVKHFFKSTFNLVPTRPKNFRVREKAEKYFMLEWQSPDNIHGSILGYKVSEAPNYLRIKKRK